MALHIVRADITTMEVDAIVNSANRNPIYGNGVDRAIYKAAGEEELLRARQQIGEIKYGDAKETRAFALKARWIIHAVVARWFDGNSGEYGALANCYRKALSLAEKLKCKSVAFPLLGTGVFGFPKKNALQIALCEFTRFLLNYSMDIYFVVFDQESFSLIKKIWPDVEDRIGDGGVEERVHKEYVDFNEYSNSLMKPINMCELGDIGPEIQKYYDEYETAEMFVSKEKDKGSFGEKVMKYIENTYNKDSTFYKAAGISNKTFYRMRDEKDYHPTKDTVWGVCFALKLDKYKAEDLMTLAGYHIDPIDVRDCICMSCLEDKIFKLMDVNERLYDKGQPLLSIR